MRSSAQSRRDETLVEARTHPRAHEAAEEVGLCGVAYKIYYPGLRAPVVEAS
jgi:hypothetical protein